MKRYRPQPPTRARIAAELDFLAPTQQATELDGEALEAADLFSRLPGHQRRRILAVLRTADAEREATIRAIEMKTHDTPTKAS